MPPTASQLRAFAILPMISGPLSIIGAAAIITIILRSHLKLSTTYHRILFSLCCCDVFQSICLGLSSLPVPKGTPNVMYAIGNQTTCDIQGFMTVLSSMSFTYYFCGLTGYFMLAIKCEVSEDNLRKYYEPIVHTVSILFGTVSAIIPAIHTGFFTTGNMCWIAPKPIRCDKDPNVECTSGNDYNTFRWALCGWPIIIVFCIVTINMLIIIWNLHSQNNTTHISLGQNNETNNHHNNHNNHNGIVNVDVPPHMERRPSIIELYEASKREKKSSKAHRNRKEGMIQALLYILAFFISYIFTIIYHGLDGTNKQPTILLILLGKVFRPIQGFNNFLIFIRPRVVNIRNKNPTYSLRQAFVEAVKSRGENQKVMRKRPSCRGTFSQARRLSETTTRNMILSPQQQQNDDDDNGDDDGNDVDDGGFNEIVDVAATAHVNETAMDDLEVDDR